MPAVHLKHGKCKMRGSKWHSYDVQQPVSMKIESSNWKDNGDMMNTDSCWLYAGYKNTIGYGQIFYTVNGKTKYQYAHRVSYETFVGVIPDGLVIDHLCRVRHCINPDHLEPVTASVNTKRGEGVLVNTRKTYCPQGHEYTTENTRIDKHGSRVCRECGRIRRRLYYLDNKGKFLEYNRKHRAKNK